MSLPYKRHEVKERSRATWHGACNVTLPSFTLSFDGLNPRAIEHDIKLGAEMGYWGTLVAAEAGRRSMSTWQFMEIAAGAAPKGFNLVDPLSCDTPEQMIAVAKAAEALGL